MAKKTLEQYIRDGREEALKQYDAAVEQLTATAEKEIKQQQAAIDHQAAKDTAQLQHQQTLTKQDSRPKYDAAAVQELVDRQNVEERMAGLGLAQSGVKNAALAGASQRRQVADQTIRRAVERAVGEWDREIAGVKAEAKEDKAAVKEKLKKQLNDDSFKLLQDYFEQADKTALSAYKADKQADDRLENLITSINKQLSDKTGGMYVYENGKIKKVKENSLYAALDKDLRFKSGGMFGISDNGTIQVLSNFNVGLLKFLDAELRKTSKGKYGVTEDGFIVILEADD